MKMFLIETIKYFSRFFVFPYFFILFIYFGFELGDVGVAALNFSKASILAITTYFFIDKVKVKNKQKTAYFCIIFSLFFVMTCFIELIIAICFFK